MVLAKPHIFYADDDRDDVAFFEDALETANVDADLVTKRGGSELLDLLDNPPPAPTMVFLDWNMPGVNGAAVLKHMRQDGRTREVPVIVLSTSDFEENIEQARKLGANLYVTKPNSFEKLVKVIRDCLSIDWQTFNSRGHHFIYSFEHS